VWLLRNDFIESLLEKARSNDKIILVTADLGYGVLDNFERELPNQFFNVGVTEQSAVSLACGLAAAGYRPFVYSIANFPTFRAMEQIRNDMNYMNLPVVIVALGEGFSYGTAGYSHHLIEDIAAFRAFNNIQIFSPTNLFEVKSSLDEIFNKSAPSLVRLSSSPTSEIFFKNSMKINSGINELIPGINGDIIFHGGMLDEVFKAEKILRDLEYQPSIKSCHNLNPDLIIDYLQNNSNKKILIVEEHVRSGGLGTMFIECAHESGYTGKISRLGIKCIEPSIVGNQNFLRKSYGLDSNSIVRAFIELNTSDVN
jgi:transketolase